jgi:DNA repair protein RecN (Recombination protein N)
MLRSLCIRNFAILDSLEISFDSGLTVFTGETGAGKTILVEAIRFLVGGKTGAEMVRTGADLAMVEGDFDGVILRRELSAQGRSRCFRDDAQITIGELATLGESLADHCGQHQHQVLLDPDRHIEWLDRFAATLDQVERVRVTFADVATATRNITDLEARIARGKGEDELRSFQIGEIRAANLEPDEEDRLKAEATVMKHARRLAETADMALNILSDDESSVETALGRVRREADNAANVDPRWNDIITPLSTAADAINDTIRALTTYRDHLSFDPQRADQIESRLSEIYRLKKKYGNSGAAILARLSELEAEQSSDVALEDDLKEAREKQRKLEDTLVALTSNLSIKRHQAAESLSRAVNTVIARLGMTKASVKIDLSPHTDGGIVISASRIHDDGAEQVRFLFEANPAEGFKPLHKIASGGELSRLLLAFKSAGFSSAVAAALEPPSRAKKRGGSSPAATNAALYIFDEIDSGIGGQTAHAVAREIKALAKNSQVFLITHLQQLANVADAHYRISKKTVSGRARVTVDHLEDDHRIHELARMIVGDDVTDRTLEFAAELASSSRKRKR